MGKTGLAGGASSSALNKTSATIPALEEVEQAQQQPQQTPASLKTQGQARFSVSPVTQSVTPIPVPVQAPPMQDQQQPPDPSRPKELTPSVNGLVVEQKGVFVCLFTRFSHLFKWVGNWQFM